MSKDVSSKDVSSKGTKLVIPSSSLVAMLAGAIMNDSQAGFITMETVKSKLADLDISGKELALASLETEVLEEIYRTENMLYVGGNNLQGKPIVQVSYLYDEDTCSLAPSLLQAGRFSLSISENEADKVVLIPDADNIYIDEYNELKRITGIELNLAKAVSSLLSKASPVKKAKKLKAKITLAASNIGCISSIVESMPVNMSVTNFVWCSDEGDDYEDGETVCDIEMWPTGEFEDSSLADKDFTALLRLLRSNGFDNISIVY